MMKLLLEMNDNEPDLICIEQTKNIPEKLSSDFNLRYFWRNLQTNKFIIAWQALYIYIYIYIYI